MRKTSLIYFFPWKPWEPLGFMRRICFPCSCSIWWFWWLCAASPGTGCGRRDGGSKADLAWCRMALDAIWLHFCSYFTRDSSTYHWMQCSRTDLKSPLRKNVVFLSSLITVIQQISLQFTYSDQKSLTNGQFSISWNTSSGCILPGHGLPWVPVHSLLCREAAWLCSSQEREGSPRSCRLALPWEHCHLCFSLLQLIVPPWFGSWRMSSPSVELFHQSPSNGGVWFSKGFVSLLSLAMLLFTSSLLLSF